MKLVFCDIDGVLNSEIGTAETGVLGIEDEKLYLLQALLESTGAELVITSKARFAESVYEERLKTIEKKGIRIRDAFRGKTLSSNPKAIEVLAYLQNKCKDIDNILILDDNDHDFSEYFKHNFILVSTKTGLTVKDVEEGIAILGKEKPIYRKRMIYLFKDKSDFDNGISCYSETWEDTLISTIKKAEQLKESFKAYTYYLEDIPSI
ncbi:MAG: hypothetical protein IJQ67_07250 [Bacilli bacterium]|nr:hypothetical protein [Bacilli bacterium]